jgi:hypothetical protein
MSSFKQRCLLIISTLLLAGAIVAQNARAEDPVSAPNASSKPPKLPSHAFSTSGTFTISGGAPCVSTPTDTCYVLSAPSLTSKKDTGSMTGMLEISGNALTGTAKGTCYSVVSAVTTENLTDEENLFTVDITFGGNICIRTTKKGSTEILPSSEWLSTEDSPETGRGHQSWIVTPTEPTSMIGPLNGTGTIHINGRVTPPAT